jgi:hypothetical protein
MYPTNPINTLPRGGRSVPRFYQAVPYRPYGAPLATGPNVPGEGDSRSGPASPDRSSQYGFATIQTVEDVIARGYLAIPTGDPVTAVLTDKRATSWLGLDDAIRQIRARYELYAQNMNGILYSTAAATNALHTWKAERGWYNERQVDNQHKTLQNLYAQEREERISLWRDIARVRATLPEVVQQYLAAHRKLVLLDGVDGDAP